MPELPDLEIYRERMSALLVGRSFSAIRVGSPFVVRSFDPNLKEVFGRTILSICRLGKQLVLAFEGDLFLVIHLMISGRLRWRRAGASHRARDVLAVFDPDGPGAKGCLVFTEASKMKRASIHVVRGDLELADLDRGGLEAQELSAEGFAERVRCERHTIKRTLTDPRLFAGIGNAYSDEILFRAKLSPTRHSTALKDDTIEALRLAVLSVFKDYTQRIREEVGDGFPDKVTAFREDFAVHGRHKLPCVECGHPIQRIVRGDHETNYCAFCQNGGRLLADRALSKLLKADWPRTLDELEDRKKNP